VSYLVIILVPVFQAVVPLAHPLLLFLKPVLLLALVQLQLPSHPASLLLTLLTPAASLLLLASCLPKLFLLNLKVVLLT
jgi:hypothetical protein